MAEPNSAEITQADLLEKVDPKRVASEGTKIVPMLTVIDEDSDAREVVIEKPQFYIGRSKDCDLVIEKPNTSRFHAFVSYENFHSQTDEPICLIEDNDSKNGTYHNGEKLTKAKRLYHGDRIVIGNVVIGFLLRREWEMEANKKIAEVLDRQGKKSSHGRISCDFTASLNVLIPDETFTPRAIKGTVKDIDDGGLRLITTEITKDFWLLLIRKKAYIKTEIVLDSLSMKIKGRMAWSHFDTKGREPACIMGIEFQELTEDQSKQIATAMKELSIPSFTEA